MLGAVFSEARRNRWLQKVHRWARKAHGWNNQTLIRQRMHRVRPPMSAAFDTNVSQLCKVERGAWYSTGKKECAGREIDTGYYGPTESPFSDQHRSEIAFLNAICEMARRQQIEIFRIPSVEEEKASASHRHVNHLGCSNIDHGIRFRELGFECPRMAFTLSKLRDFPILDEKENCSINIENHDRIFEYLSGKKQLKYAWHIMLCDSFDIEFSSRAMGIS